MTREMNLIAAIVLLGVLAGCKKQDSPKTEYKAVPQVLDVHVTQAEIEAQMPVVVPHKEPKYIADFRVAADKHALDWDIKCEGDYYLASAWDYGTNFDKEWIEDGARAYWQTSQTTRKDAVLKLAELIKHEPNVTPRHKPKDKNHRCLPPLAGGVGMESKYADDHCKSCSTND